MDGLVLFIFCWMIHSQRAKKIRSEEDDLLTGTKMNRGVVMNILYYNPAFSIDVRYFFCLIYEHPIGKLLGRPKNQSNQSISMFCQTLSLHCFCCGSYNQPTTYNIRFTFTSSAVYAPQSYGSPEAPRFCANSSYELLLALPCIILILIFDNYHHE